MKTFRKKVVAYILIGVMLIMSLQTAVFADGTETTTSSDIVVDVTQFKSVSNTEQVSTGTYWKQNNTKQNLIFADNAQNATATYEFNVPAGREGRYTLNMGVMSWSSVAKVGVSVNNSSVTTSKVAIENDYPNNIGDLPKIAAKNIVLQEGTNTLVISNQNAQKLFIDSLVFTNAVTIKADGATAVLALAYSSASEISETEANDAIFETSYHGANGNNCLLVGKQNDVWVEYKIVATKETAGRYNLGIRSGSWTGAARLQASMGGTTIGTVTPQNVDKDYDKTQNKLPLVTAGSVVLSEGENIVRVTNKGNTHAFLQEIVFSKPINQVNGTTVIDALNYSDATAYTNVDNNQNGVKVDTHWKTGENYIQFTGYNKNEIKYKLNVAEGKSGRYRIKATTWSWLENPTQILCAAIDGEEETWKGASFVGNDKTVNVDVSQRVFPVSDLGNIYLAEGEQTLNFYGSNCHGLYIKSIELEYVEDKTFITNIPAAGAEVSALNYNIKSDSVKQNTNWSGKDKLSMKFTGGANAVRNELTYKVNVDQAGKYNIGIKTMGWQAIEPYIKVWVDGKMRGYIHTQDDIYLNQVDVVPFYVRSTDLTAGEHTIMLESYWGCDTFIEGIVIQPIGTSDTAPAAVSYNRAENALTGYAEGSVTITPPSSFDGNIAAYHLYWGNDSGKLENYSAFGFVLADKNDQTKAVTYEIPKGVMIPQGATKILAYIAKRTEPDYSSYGQTYHISENVLELNAYASTDIGASAISLNDSDLKCSIAVLSDQHVKDTADHVYSVNTKYAFSDIVATRPNAVAVLAGGDNVDDGAKDAQYQVLKGFYDTTLGAADIPYYITTGNHEKTGNAPGSGTGYETTASGATLQRDLFKTYANEFAGSEIISDANKLYWSKKVSDDIYLISLSSETSTAYYYPSTAQLDWLEEQLDKAEREEATAIVFCHQPIKNTVAGSIEARRKDSGWNADEIEPNAEIRLKELLTSHKNAVFFSGHSHTKADSVDSSYVFGDDGYARYINVPNTGVRYGGSSRQEVILGADDAANLLLTGENVEKRTWDYYVNYYTNMPEGFIIDVYSDYIAVRGRSYDTFEWVGSAQYLIPTNYSIFTAEKKNNAIEITKNENYDCSQAYGVYVALFDGSELVGVQYYTKAQVESGKITFDLADYQVTNPTVNIYTWNDDMQPIRNVVPVAIN